MHAPPGAGAAMLEAMQGCLQQAGLQCAVDAAAYSIQASYSPSTQELAAAAEAEAEGLAAAGPAGKRRRADGGGADAAARQGPWKLELHLFMQHAGLFLLTAALHKSAPDGALAWFGAQARALHQALAARWKVQA